MFTYMYSQCGNEEKMGDPKNDKWIIASLNLWCISKQGFSQTSFETPYLVYFSQVRVQLQWQSEIVKQNIASVSSFAMKCSFHDFDFFWWFRCCWCHSQYTDLTFPSLWNSFAFLMGAGGTSASISCNLFS